MQRPEWKSSEIYFLIVKKISNSQILFGIYREGEALTHYNVQGE